MKRSKILSMLLAAMIIVSCFSCLTVTSFAANVVASGYTADTKDAEDEADKVVAWELYDDGKLYIYQDVEGPEWILYTEDITEVIVTGKSDTEPCGATRIPASAFKGYPNLEKVDLRGSAAVLDTIEGFAFEDCDNLTEVSIPGVTTIGDYAFYDCDNLEKVFIGGGLITVGKNIFKSCDKLATVELANGCYNIGYGMFEDCISLKTIDLPDSIETIGELAFDECTSLVNIIVPDSVTSVGRYAYHNCTAAQTLYIGHNAEDVGEYAFYGCTALTDVKIACAMRVISEGTFMDCTSLVNFDIEESVETIGKNAFKNCTSLTSFDIPITVKEIGDTAFANTGLTSVTIPAEVEAISKGAFTGCASLTAINVDVYNDNYYSVDGIVYDMELSTVVVCPAGKSGDIVIKNGTTTIAEDAFIGCSGVASVEIPGSVTEIANTAFNGIADTVVIKTRCDYYANEYAIARGIATELTHVSSVWEETLAPTCLDKGTKQLVCESCKYVYETQEIDALGHAYDNGTITTPATCTTDGVVTFTCTRTGCDESYTEVLPATNHRINTGEIIVNATCTADGTRRFSCENEGCYYSYDTVIPATGHNLNDGVITTPATCVDDGVKTFSCKNDGCGHKVTELVPATGHSYDGGVVTTAATCEADGVLTYTCQNCADSYTEVIPATGHNYISTEIKKATCVEDGKLQFVCSNCGDSYVEATKGEHIFYSAPVTIAPTCTKDGITGNKCSVCNQFIGETTVVPATGHTFNANGLCSCGASNSTQQPTTPSTPSGKAPKTPKVYAVKNVNEGMCVTWGEVENATSYKIYRRGTNTGWQYLTTVSAPASSYVDTTAAANSYYRYTVRAVNANGISLFENGAYTKRVPTPHLTSIKHAAHGITITWDAVEQADSYRIYRRVPGGAWNYLATTEGTSYKDGTVQASTSGTVYIYTVRAVDHSISHFESGISIRYVATPVISSVKNTSNGVSVKWGAVKEADWYAVYRRTAGGKWVLVGKTTSTSFVDKSVKNDTGVVYRYTVRAVNGKYVSGFLSGISIRYVATPVISSVKNTSNGVSVKWGAVKEADWYAVYRRTAGGKWVLVGKTTSTSFVDKSVKNDTGVVYRYTVRAVNGKYVSGFLSGVSIRVK